VGEKKSNKQTEQAVKLEEPAKLITEQRPALEIKAWDSSPDTWREHGEEKSGRRKKIGKGQ
jgi:hypothetical protein